MVLLNQQNGIQLFKWDPFKFIATDASKLLSQASEQIYYGTGDGKFNIFPFQHLIIILYTCGIIFLIHSSVIWQNHHIKKETVIKTFLLF